MATAAALAVGTVIARAVLTPPEHTETGGDRDLLAQRRWLQEQFDQALAATSPHGARVRLEWGENADISADLATCAAHHGCDLVVMGRHGGDTHLRPTGLGPVARALTERTTLPVLLMSTETRD
ncbi:MULTISPECIES: universal stress protein [Streptomyces]|uniref:universal stress protein n=1 Tax=Streptomyces noursei TaxID=1971 RepID=UPI00099C8DEC|nr:universal stress protein [Streptomyces noursei]